MIIIVQYNNDFAQWFHDFIVKFSKQLKLQANTRSIRVRKKLNKY